VFKSVREAVLVQGVLRGMNLEAKCTVRAVKVSLPKSDAWEYVCVDITHAPADLPQGSYEVSFEDTMMVVDKTARGWASGTLISARLEVPLSRTELKIDYDHSMMPVSATCSACSEQMPQAPADLTTAADIIVRISGKYLEHRTVKHSNHDRRQIPRS